MRYFVSIVFILSLVFLLFLLGSLAAPVVVTKYLDARGAIESAMRGGPDRPGQSGLIYVESPEVYTRQRLVNDRYLQDAWLRDRLKEVNDTEAGWIEAAELDRRQLAFRLAAGDTSPDISEPGSDDREPIPPANLSEKALDLLAEVPFSTRFELQSQARDEIRQLILENALDDRHDLSGNTVFGLKFDTAILPGSDARLNPTVVVKMEPTPLDALLSYTDPNGATSLRAPEEFVSFFTRLGRSAADEEDIPEEDKRIEAILTHVDGYFRNWRRNVEQRVEEKWRPREQTCTPQILSRPLCGAGGLDDSARQGIARLLEQTEYVDAALSYVTRLPLEDAFLARELRGQILENASVECQKISKDEPSSALGRYLKENKKSNTTVTVGDFLKVEAENRSTRYGQLPEPWGRFFQTVTRFQLREYRDSCEVIVDFGLEEPNVQLFFYQGEKAPRADARQLSCSECQSTSQWIVLPPRNSKVHSIQVNAVTPETLLNIEKETLPIDSHDICRQGGSGIPFELPVDPDARAIALKEYFELDTSETTWEAFARDQGFSCVPGRQVQLRFGAFEFFRKMSEVESYTYAAFPRGDVSGVVTEAETGVSAAAGGSGGGLVGKIGGSVEQSRREIAAEPAVVNFAAGQSRLRSPNPWDDPVGQISPELFDFGWTVVKPGLKDPMMVSQLVLVSVPAYLDEIKLTVWKGFMDLNRVPSDRAASRDERPPFNQLSLEQRISELMDGVERRSITLKVPSDYNALDNIAIDRTEIVGPQIDTAQLGAASENGTSLDVFSRLWDNNCLRPIRTIENEQERFSLSLVIPGERLWRSTVVTLMGQKADRIEVMPDMRGIVASFSFAEVPQRRTAEWDLWVWTSEGKAREKITICPPVDVGEAAATPEATPAEAGQAAAQP
ncbi:hypothetical protein [Tropicimonas sp. TH_r6]|uniref:hypothetical protein n=1 Tax=Tropicimonas sp. TH_r6 TaxID=3082085 RepID=UPI0029549EFB|nr:hypothetical protein [Tropicimonas sp. TH_r6]